MEAEDGKDSLSRPGTVILIPAFNEAAVIASVIEEISRYCNFAVIVIDDCSSDDTIAVSRRAGAEVIALPAQLGAWGATQTGLRFALKKGYTMAICMDADGQHDPASLAKLIRPVEQNEADVAIGCCTTRGSTLRKLAWVLMKRVSGLTLEDITSGYRVYNRPAIRALSSRRATLLDYQDIGVLLFLQSRGLRIVDREVNMRLRSNGPSRVFHSWLMVAYYMCQTLLLGFSKRGFSTTPQQTASNNQAKGPGAIS